MQDFYLILTNQLGATSWPITAVTFMLMRKVNAADKNKEVLKFLEWGSWVQIPPLRPFESGVGAVSRHC